LEINPESSFPEDIRQAAEGDSSAFQRIYLKYGPHLEQALRRKLNSALRRIYDTVDLRHSVMIEVLRDLPEFEDRGEPAFLKWLVIKAENKVRAKYRKHLWGKGGRREVTLHAAGISGPDSENQSPVSSSSRNELQSRVRGALEGLDARQRKVVQLRNDEALSYAEVAAWLNLQSPEAARKLYARALLKLRKTWTFNSNTPSMNSSADRNPAKRSPPKS
jgi:RNA polymerase sigma factor (sigma-70 family)